MPEKRSDQEPSEHGRRLAQSGGDHIEIYCLRHGPDGLTRITLRTIRWVQQESWLEPTPSATESILRRWAVHHHRLLGFHPVRLGPWLGATAAM